MTNTFSSIIEGNISGLAHKKFRKKINDKQTDLFVLTNTLEMEVAVTNYECAILSIMVADKNGTYANAVPAGHDSVESIINSFRTISEYYHV
jgi:aldose 1-epimerase